MALIDKQRRQVWEGLRGNRPHRQDFLEEINIRHMRGIQNLRVRFDYPVTVVAGENACGKSTVLFGCAAAYKIPGTTAVTNAPATLFPNFSQNGTDDMKGIELEYAYITNGQRLGMVWRRGKAWNKSFLGRKGASQPKRNMYLRTLANLTNPSEVRSMLQIKYKKHTKTHIAPEWLLLARRVLTSDYQDIHKVKKSRGAGDLLLAKLADGAGAYSEFHMASGERSILRLSIEISRLDNTLVLIDEVETGLHPHIQKLLMLNLQQMALRQNLQIIVTTHSPVVLDCVPREGRVFLSRVRQTHDVNVLPPMRDVLQKAMYGQSTDKLSILCEDEVAEAIVLGVVDALSVQINFAHEQIKVGRDTGKDEFANHARVLAKMDLLADFVFALDGDARALQQDIARAASPDVVPILFLPGELEPEAWLWGELSQAPAQYQSVLAVPRLSEALAEIEQTMRGAIGTRDGSKYKVYLHELAEQTQRTPAEFARTIARTCTTNHTRDMLDFATNLQDAIQHWRGV